MAKQLIYQGEAKKLFATDDPALAVLHYTDDAIADRGLKRGIIMGKGAVNNRVSNHLFKFLEEHGVNTHLVSEAGERDSVVRRLEIIPLEVIVRNIAAGSLARRLALPEGMRLGQTVVEFCYKSDELDDPLVNETHIAALGLATPRELRVITDMALRINELLCEYFRTVNIELIDFKLEFGRLDGEIVLADEISPDTCRLWDRKTGERLDKDRFRFDLGDVEDAYQEIFRRVLGGNAK